MAEAATQSVNIAPLPREDVGRVAHLQLPPAQRGFVGLIEEMAADPDVRVDLFQITTPSEVIGFFKIDRAFERIEPRLPPGAHGLRGLLIGGQYQRLGLGAQALEQLPGFLAAHYPGQSMIYLAVDLANTAAIRAYTAHSWSTCEMAPRDGRTGPEQILTLTLGGKDA